MELKKKIKNQFKWKILNFLVINYSGHLCSFKQEKINIIIYSILSHEYLHYILNVLKYIVCR